MFCMLVFLVLFLQVTFYSATEEMPATDNHFENVYNEIQHNENLTKEQKQRLTMKIYNAVYHFKLDQLERKRAEIENERHKEIQRHNSIYRKYLVSRANGSSFLNDFITMRY